MLKGTVLTEGIALEYVVYNKPVFCTFLVPFRRLFCTFRAPLDSLFSRRKTEPEAGSFDRRFQDFAD